MAKDDELGIMMIVRDGCVQNTDDVIILEPANPALTITPFALVGKVWPTSFRGLSQDHHMAVARLCPQLIKIS